MLTIIRIFWWLVVGLQSIRVIYYFYIELVNFRMGRTLLNYNDGLIRRGMV